MLEIKTEEQAKKYKRYLEVAKEATAIESELGINSTLLDISAALAAYESRDRVKEIAEGLSSLERDVLLAMTQDRGSLNMLTKGLATEGYYDTVAILKRFKTPLAHEVAAYLRQKEEPRKFKWEVWHLPIRETFICACKTELDARQNLAIRAKYLNRDEEEYEVREVK